jgi:hypothetical protein
MGGGARPPDLVPDIRGVDWRYPRNMNTPLPTRLKPTRLKPPRLNPPRAIQRHALPWLLALAAMLLVATGFAAPLPNGTWRHFKDSDGKVPKSGAVVEITFGAGTFTFKAVQPGETIEDRGSFKVDGRTITLEFRELEKGKQSGAYSVSTDTMVLPFTMLGDARGWSIWMRPAAVESFLAKVPARPAGPEPMPALLARVQKVAEAFGNDKERAAMDQRAKARAGAYRGGLAEAYYAQSALLFMKGYYREAWYGFARAAVLKPTNAVYLHNLATTLQEIGSATDARTILEWVTKNYPNLDPPFGSLGTTCMQLQEAACAKGALARARALAPENGLYDYATGKLLESEGRKDEAQRYFNAAWSKGYGGSGNEGGSAANPGASQPGSSAAANAAASAAAAAAAARNAAAKRSNPQQRNGIPDEWVGRYQAKVVSARSGMDGDRATTFGKGMSQTTLMLQTLACAQQFTMDVSKSGAISGRGRLMYVYQGSAANPAMMLAPAAAVAGAGGFAVNLKDGKQFRDWSFSGQVSPDGTVEINGLPDEAMDMLNVGKWEKHRPWSALPPSDKAHMRGPFRMTLASEQGGPPAIRVDQALQLDDALIKRVRYQAYIFRSDADVKPECRHDEPARPKCAASEYLKTKGVIGADGGYTIESSRDMKTGETTVTSKVGGGEATGGFGADSAGNVSYDGSAGALVGSAQFNPTDGSYSMSVGVGVDTGSVLPGPAKLSEKVELVYDSACGWGIKGTGSVSAGAAGAGVEGAIYFSKGV